MSEKEIIRDLKSFIALAQKEVNFIYYSEYKFDNELAERVKGLLDLYNKEKQKNKEYENKIKSVLELIDTKPYTAYTLYGDILYDDENIRELLEERN